METQLRDQLVEVIKIVDLIEVVTELHTEHRSPKTEPWGVSSRSVCGQEKNVRKKKLEISFQKLHVMSGVVGRRDWE